MMTEIEQHGWPFAGLAQQIATAVPNKKSFDVLRDCFLCTCRHLPLSKKYEQLTRCIYIYMPIFVNVKKQTKLHMQTTPR